MSCAHRWRLSALPTDDAFSARCWRCGAERSFPIAPKLAFNAGHFARGAGQAREMQREYAELMRQAVEAVAS